jgi:hypothetical protein
MQGNGNLGTNSALTLGPRKSTEKLDRVTRSQDLADTADPLILKLISIMLKSFGSYLTGNTIRLRYKAQPVNAVWGNSRCLL